MDLPELRSDDSERHLQKLVEASIGSRLNSRAIRGIAEKPSPSSAGTTDADNPEHRLARG